jgi:RHS repeat-associated protein
VQPTVQNLAYGYDNLGNVTSRYDGVNGTNETFAYDTMNQLASVAVTTGAASGSEAYIYDAVGNMTFRSNLGTMTYGPGGAGGVPAGKIGPHQLASMRVDHQNSPYYPAFAGMSGSTSTCTTQTGNSIYRCYAYWNAGMVSTVTERTNQLSYTYDEARRRVHSHELVSNVKTEETWYLWGPAGVFSHQQQNMDPTGQNVVSTEWHDYIQLGGRLVGEYASTTNSSGTTASTYYFHTDAQGSVTAITGGGAVVVEQDSYDAWGKQRQTNGAIDTGAGGNAHSGATCALAANDVQNRGWIGQESLGRRGVCLSDLNARLYDSLTASFVQPDPVVGQPFSTHGWNAYAYAGNNPMTFSDPTGMCFAGCFWKQSLFREIVGMAVAFALDQWEVAALQGSLGSVGAGVIAAGTSGAAHGAIASGTLKGTLLSAGEALANFGIGQIGGAPEGGHYYDLGNVAARGLLHAAAGGLFSVAEGGHYKSGFLAGGFVALAGPGGPAPDDILDRLLGYAQSAVIGGIGSTLGGGKFENGAVTGAFEYLYNDAQIHELTAQAATQSDKQLARDGVVKALSLINPNQDESSNIVPYDGNNAKVVDVSKIDTSGWVSGTSGHASALYRDVPGYDGLGVKIYLNDSERENLTTIGLIHSANVEHLYDWFFLYSSTDRSNHTNADIARGFCSKVSGGCP